MSIVENSTILTATANASIRCMPKIFQMDIFEIKFVQLMCKFFTDIRPQNRNVSRILLQPGIRKDPV